MIGINPIQGRNSDLAKPLQFQTIGNESRGEIVSHLHIIMGDRKGKGAIKTGVVVRNLIIEVVEGETNGTIEDEVVEGETNGTIKDEVVVMINETEEVETTSSTEAGIVILAEIKKDNNQAIRATKAEIAVGPQHQPQHHRSIRQIKVRTKAAVRVALILENIRVAANMLLLKVKPDEIIACS